MTDSDGVQPDRQPTADPGALPQPETKVELGPQVEQALQGGMAAIQKLMDGFVQMAQKFAGPDVVRNYEAGRWLGRVAASLDDAAGQARAPGVGLSGKSGELAFYLEHLSAELNGSKFAAEEAALRGRLEGAARALDRLDHTNGADPADLQTLTSAAGYFRAAANSALPPVGPDGTTVTVHKT